MGYIRDFTTSATQAADVYADIASLLTAEGWTRQGMDITDPSFTWRVWRNSALNSGLGKDFHIGIGIANSGTGSLRFRLFEDLAGGSRILRPAPNNGFTLGTSPDAYGDKLHDTTQALFPVPWTPGSGSWASSNPAADYSVAAWGRSNQTNATAGDQALVAAAPPEMDLRSIYVLEISQNCDDSTAVEYIIYVSNKAFTIGTKEVFNTTHDWLYVGAYEPLSMYDVVPVVIMNPAQGPKYFTRNWEYVDLPFTLTVRPGTGFTVAGAPRSFGRVYGTVTQTPTSATNLSDWNWRGPLGTRVQISDQQLSTVVRGVAYDLVYMPSHATGGIPPIEFGDEVSINGVAHTLLKPSNVGAGAGTLWVPQT